MEKDLTVFENGIMAANGTYKCEEKCLNSKRDKISDKLMCDGAGVPVAILATKTQMPNEKLMSF